MTRLYQAASSLPSPIRGQSELARQLGQSPQTVKNWESRPTGVSAAGAATAQKMLGISSTWILNGELPMLVGRGRSPASGQSQSAGSIRETMEGAVNIVRRVQDMAIEPIQGERYVQLLSEAFSIYQDLRSAHDLSEASLDDAAREVAARLRSTG